MKLIIDANVIFSAFLKEGTTRKLMVYGLFEPYTPKFVIEEFFEHIDELASKSEVKKGILKGKIKEFLMNSNIKLYSKKELSAFIEDAKKISPDIDDMMYFAAALKLNCPIWSNDKKLKGQNKVKIYFTSDLIQEMSRTE